MPKKVAKLLCLMVVCLMLASAAAGCASNQQKQQESSNGTTQSEKKATQDAKDYWDMLDTVSDSSDLPAWPGKQLNLRLWEGHGSGEAQLKKSAGDVVTPEILRVTGVQVDKENSFDNGGQTIDVKMGMLAAADDWPDLIQHPEMSGGIGKLADQGLIYDLTDLIPKYMPNLMKKLGKEWLDKFVKNDISLEVKGKIYAVPAGINERIYAEVDSSVDTNKYAVFNPPAEAQGYVYVRDDILKKLYPDSKTQKEIEDLYMQNGSFSKKDILDISINSKDEFFKFLYDIKKVIDEEKLKEGNQPVSTISIYQGIDNWALLAGLNSYLEGSAANSNYFTYWDKMQQKIEFGFKQPWFKDDLKLWNKVMRDGLAPKESLIDSNTVFKEKVSKGLYAVIYPSYVPDYAALEKAGKPYSYRKVYLSIPFKSDQYVMFKPYPAQLGSFDDIAIFKNSVKEEDLPQVLRWLDFMMSDVGEKLECWGPRSAGLWDEKDGKRTFKDKDLENEMVYGATSENWLNYNLGNPWPNGNTVAESFSVGFRVSFAHYFKSKFSPAYTYDRVRNKSEANTYFSMGFVEPATLTEAMVPNFWKFNASVKSAENAWKARQAFEDALIKTMAVSSDTQFEKVYNDFLSIADKSGYNDNTLEEINAAFPKMNEGFMQNLK